MKILVFIISVLLLMVSSCSPIQPQSPQSQEPIPQEPICIFFFSGSTGKTSDVFYVSKEHWYIEWECKPDAFSQEHNMGISFSVTLFPTEESLMKPMALIANTTTPGADRTYIHNWSGEFYIEVDTMFVKSWTIEVYE